MKTNTNRSLIQQAVRLSFIALTVQQLTAAPLGTAFTYQGRLLEGTNAYTGNAEFIATLWDASSGGTALATNGGGSVIVGVTNGLFVMSLDFGTNFSGEARWLQLEVRTTIGPFTTLSPRQALTPAPHALYASSAGTAATASSVPAANVTGTLADARLFGNVALLNAGQAFTGANTFGNAGNSFTGNGLGLTALSADNLGSGTVPDVRLAANIPRLNNNQTFTGNNIFNGNNSFTGDGSGLTSLNANSLNIATTVPGTCLSGLYSLMVNFNNGGNSFVGSFNGTGAGLTSLNGNNLASGTVPDGRLSANVALLAGAQTFTGIKTFQAAPSFSFAGAPFSVANSTLVGGLNADLLDGYHAGNAANNVALNNGTLNVNLNADLLDGSHAAAFAPASASANYIQNQNSSAQSANLWISGSAKAGSFAGDGSALTSLNANNLASGLMPDARLTVNIPRLNGNQTFSGNNTFSSVYNSFTGDGSGLNYLNASSLTGGTLPSARLSGTYSSAVTFSSAANSFTGNGAGLTSVNADTVDSVHASGFPQIRASGAVAAGSTLTLGIPHYTLFTLQLSCGWPQTGGLASVLGFENDGQVAITYMKYNGDGTSAAGGSEAACSSTSTLLIFGNGSSTNTVRCAGDSGQPYHLVLIPPTLTLEMVYRLIY